MGRPLLSYDYGHNNINNNFTDNNGNSCGGNNDNAEGHGEKEGE